MDAQLAGGAALVMEHFAFEQTASVNRINTAAI
jgi:hypothetical protein